MHNRCPKCGEIILYCDPVIESYSNGTLDDKLETNSKRFLCYECPIFDNSNCKFTNYYGFREGRTFNGGDDGQGLRHYHARCVLNDHYTYRGQQKFISDHTNEFFAQIPKIQGLENL
jgi:hypothetical protein